jgi:hypothetical protein
MDKSIIADAVASEFVLSADLAERVAVAAEMCADATFDFSKGCDSVAAVLGSLRADGGLTFDRWEAVRVAFERVATVRAKDNGATNPAGAGSDCWGRVVKRNKEIHGLTKPTAENPDAERMREKRAAERAELLAAYAGQSSATLKAEQVENYKVATPESIAKAKALDKAIKVVERAEKETRKGSLEVLRKSAQDQFKVCLSALVERGDERGISNLIVLLKQLPDACATRDSISVQ